MRNLIISSWIILLLPRLPASTEFDPLDEDLILDNYEFGLLYEPENLQSATQAEPYTHLDAHTHQLAETQPLDKYTPPPPDERYLNDQSHKRIRLGSSNDEFQTNINSPIVSNPISLDQLHPQTSFTTNPVRSSPNAPYLTQVPSVNPSHRTPTLPNQQAERPYNDPMSRILQFVSHSATRHPKTPRYDPFSIAKSTPKRPPNKTPYTLDSFRSTTHITPFQSTTLADRNEKSLPTSQPRQRLLPFPNPFYEWGQSLQQDQSSHLNLENSIANGIPSTISTSNEEATNQSLPEKELKLNYPMDQLSLLESACQFPYNPKDENLHFSYRLINFEPINIDGQIIIEAINFLEVPGEKKFFNIPTSQTNSKKSITSHPPKLIQRLFSLYYSADTHPDNLFKLFYSKWGTTQVTGESDASFLFLEKWKRLMSDKSEDKPEYAIERFTNYARFICAPLHTRVTEMRERIASQFCSDSVAISGYSKHLEQAIYLLPLFMLYVNLISAILPVQDFTNPVHQLRIAQVEAGKMYLQIIESYIFKTNQKPSNMHISRYQALQDLHFSQRRARFHHYAQAIPFIWKSINYWMATSRAEIVSVAMAGGQVPFKFFFTSLVQCWFKKIGSRSPTQYDALF